MTNNGYEVSLGPAILTPEDLYGYPETGGSGKKTQDKANPVQSVPEANEVQKQVTTKAGKSPFGSLAIIVLLVVALVFLHELFK